VNVNQKRATGDDLRLTLPARQQAPGRLLRYSAHGRHSRSTGKHTPDGSYSRRPRLAERESIWSFPLHNPDANRLKLKLTHRPDCSDAISATGLRSRKLRA
jgi:hypothetical protein